MQFIYRQNLEHELLTEHEEYILLQKAQSGDPNAREKLVLWNLRLVHSIVSKYARVERGITTDDLMADGIIGLNKAIDKYDETFGTRLSTYATYVIESVVRRSPCLEGVVRLPEDVRYQVREINRIKAALQSEGVHVTVEAIAERTQIPVADIERLFHYESDVLSVTSLDTLIYHDTDVRPLMDIIPDPKNGDGFHQVEMEVSLEFFLSRLTVEERKLIEYCFGFRGEKSNKEIAAAFGVLPRYIPQMLRDVMERLRKLGKAVRGTPEEIQKAIENPDYVMWDQGSLFEREMRKPGTLRKPKTKKQDTPDMENKDGAEQLKLFD